MAPSRIALWIAFLFTLQAPAEAGSFAELAPELRAVLQALTPAPADPLSEAAFATWYRTDFCAQTAADPGATARCASPARAFAAFAYERRTLAERVSLACVLTRVRDQLPGFPIEPSGVRSIAWAGDSATLDLDLAGGSDSAIRAALEGLGFTASNGSCWKGDCLWGLRDSRVGPLLHWKWTEVGGSARPVINVHIDLFNPGATSSGSGYEANLTGLHHLIRDELHRRENYTPLAIVAAFDDGCGLGLTELTEVLVTATGEDRERLLAIIARRCRGAGP